MEKIKQFVEFVESTWKFWFFTLLILAGIFSALYNA